MARRLGRRHNRTLATLAGIALVLSALALSCANPTPKQYRTLSFFFDGVPNPYALAVDDDTGGPTSGLVARPRVSEASAHPKKGGWECKRCHGQYDNKMRGTPAELCAQCHTREKFPKGKLHGPLNVGECIACHDPHRSVNSHLLRLPVPQLCMGCHEKTITYQEIDEHIEDKGGECTRCHDPHASTRDAFLRKVFLPVVNKPIPQVDGTEDDTRAENSLVEGAFTENLNSEEAKSTPSDKLASPDTKGTKAGPDSSQDTKPGPDSSQSSKPGSLEPESKR